MSVVIAAAVTLPRHDARASLLTVDLGTASGFAVLAGAGITVAGAVNTTTVTGDIGSYPTASVTGLGNMVLHGNNQTPNTSLMLSAQNSLATAFTDAAGRSATTSYAPAYNLGGQTLTSGVYYDSSSFGLTGVLTLDAHGNPDAVFIIQAGSALTTDSGSSVQLINGAQASDVFWVVGSSATLGTSTTFAGNILAESSITADTGATIDGRLLAENGTVTFDANTLTEPLTSVVPESNTIIAGLFLLLPVGTAALRKLRASRAFKPRALAFPRT